MSRHRIPLGWPRYDPRRHRFPVPNAVWEYKLKPVEFVIFSCLCYYTSHGQATEFTPEMVADSAHLSTSTTKRYLAGLVDKGLITNEWSPAPALHLTDSKNFFTLPNEIFLLNPPPSAFMVYAYLMLIEDRRSHTCHPSYNTIAAATGMAKNTAMKSITVLLEMRLITMDRTQYFDKCGMKWNGNNLYTILPASTAVDVFHQRQLDQLTLAIERKRILKRQEEYDRRRLRTPLCAPAPVPNDT